MNDDKGVSLMNMMDYQDLASRTANNNLGPQGLLTNCALGIAGEAGEVAGLIKKHVFHGHPLDKDALNKELGDVLWYVSQVARAAGIGLSDVAVRNINKLKARYPEGFSQERSINRAE